MKATYSIVVDNIISFKEFYNKMGFDVISLDNNSIFVKFPNSDSSILVTTSKELHNNYLDDFYIEVSPNKQIVYFYIPSITKIKSLADDMNLQYDYVQSTFNEKMEINDLLGNRLLFISTKTLSNHEILEHYYMSLNMFKSVINNISILDLEIKSDSTNWTIKQIINHLIEVELNGSSVIRFLLAQPGSNFISNTYNSDVWAENLRYDTLNIKNACKLFESNRQYLFELLKIKEEPLDTYIVHNKRKLFLSNQLQSITTHTMEHLDEVKKLIREKGIGGKDV